MLKKGKVKKQQIFVVKYTSQAESIPSKVADAMFWEQVLVDYIKVGEIYKVLAGSVSSI